MKTLLSIATVMVGCLALAAANDDPAVGSTSAGQATADAIKGFASSDGALIPAGLINKPLAKSDLSTTLAYPSDGIVVLSLTGSQLREAFERSVLLYPQPNVGFLQLSGFEVTFNKSSLPDSRVTAVTVNGSKLEDGRKYEVAMPTSLQRGQLGYSNLWDKAKVVRTFASSSLLSVLKGKHSSASPPRWLQQG